MKILIVDDSKAMRLIVMRTLRQAGFGNHVKIEASNGVEALALIQSEAPDLVLSDWNMPEMSGIELLQKARARGLRVQFIFVTSEGTAEMRQIAASAGALGLISKPFTVENFKTELSQVLS